MHVGYEEIHNPAARMLYIYDPHRYESIYLRLNLVGQRCRGGELMRHKNEEMERAMGGVRECRERRERRRVEGEGERGRGKTSQGQRER